MKRVKRAAAAVCAAVMLFAAEIPQTAVLSEQINDAKYDSYANMNVSSTGHPKYTVPNLFRGDAAYSNYKVYPLVVTAGVEYVPVDIFAQFPYLNVSYSRIGYGFYISNTRNGKYVAFDLDSGTTSTNDLLSVDIESEIYYSTNYVPAEEVCAALGLRFESYDDEQNGIRAARISGAPSAYTLSDLVVMYSPVKRTDETASDSSAGTGTPSPNTETKADETAATSPNGASTAPEPAKQEDKTAEDKKDGAADSATDEPPKPADPFETMAARQIYLVIDASAHTDAAAMLSTLERAGKQALFLVSPQTDASDEDSRLEASAIRGILMGGHELGLTFTPRGKNDVLRSGEDIVAELEAKNTRLLLYGKRKTRFVYAASDREALVKNGTEALLAEHGFVLLPELPRFAAATPAKTVAERICGDKPHLAKSVGICLPLGAETTLEECLTFFAAYRAFRVRVPDEFMKLA